MSWAINYLLSLPPAVQLLPLLSQELPHRTLKSRTFEIRSLGTLLWEDNIHGSNLVHLALGSAQGVKQPPQRAPCWKLGWRRLSESRQELKLSTALDENNAPPECASWSQPFQWGWRQRKSKREPGSARRWFQPGRKGGLECWKGGR